MDDQQHQNEAADGRSDLTAVLGQMLSALEIAQKFCGSLSADDCPDTVAIPINNAVNEGRKAMGKCYFDAGGMLRNADGARSIFDDVDA